MMLVSFRSYSGSEEKNGESEDGGEEEEGGNEEDEGADGAEENGKEGENGHVESTDTNGNVSPDRDRPHSCEAIFRCLLSYSISLFQDRKRVSDVGGEAATAEDGAPALKKKKAEEEEVGDFVCRLATLPDGGAHLRPTNTVPALLSSVRM